MCDSKKVLIVDDDEHIRFGVARRLQAAGYTTCTADDGENGLRAASVEEPDLVLMDVSMPRKDGLAIMSEMQSDPRTNMIPIVMLSACLRDQQRTLEAGAKFFVKKPYSPDQLLSAVEAAIH